MSLISNYVRTLLFILSLQQVSSTSTSRPRSLLAVLTRLSQDYPLGPTKSASTSGSSSTFNLIVNSSLIDGVSHNGSELLNSRINLIFAGLQLRLRSRTEEEKLFFHEATRFGLPSYDNLLFRSNYIASYDNRLKQPVWVLEYLKHERLTLVNAEKNPRYTFSPDWSIHRFFRSRDHDYKYSDYDRGHLAPACDNMAFQRMLDESFLFSNVAPQVPNLNQGGCPWTRLEGYALYLARRSKKVYIVTGTLHLPVDGKLTNSTEDEENVVSYRVIGSNRVAVPTHFYKILVKENNHGRLSMEGFLVPNRMDVDRLAKLEEFQIDIDTDLPLIEQASGLTFYGLLDRKEVIRPRKVQYGFGG